MTTPLDLEWARRCAADFADKPTEARARNAAQCLAGLLDAYDDMSQRLAFAGVVWPAELCRARFTFTRGGEWVCGLAVGHYGRHSTNTPARPATWRNERQGPDPQELYDQAPHEPCPGFFQRRPEDARLACFKPAGHAGDHSNAPEWLKVGIDPCPARSHQQESCLKGYLHTGGHEWGGTKTVVAGPELPDAPELCRYPGCENPEDGMGHFHITDRSGQI